MADDSGRLYPARPFVGVSSLITRGPDVLLVRRAHPPRLWSLPGGLVEVGETLEVAARREVVEETGLEVTIERFLTTLDVIRYDEAGGVKYHYVLTVFAAQVVGGQLAAGDDADAAEWVAVTALGDRPMTPGVADLVEQFT